jgi:carboxyl-terminal processing protease
LESAVSGKFADTDAFILDLRDGFGGRPERFADVFFRPDVKVNWDFGSNKNVQHFGYGKPLVVLINSGSRSAKELLSYILKSSKRATLIGTQTAGNVLGTSPNRINDWCILELPMVDVSVDGVRLEKNGVQPNIKVLDGFDKDGNDVVIGRAVEFLTNKKH